MITTKVALDTNVLIYSHDQTDLRKQDIARTLLDLLPTISIQAVLEYINVLRRKMSIPKGDVVDLCLGNIDGCIIQSVNVSTLKIAKHIIQYYDLQIFDSIIVASAIEADCEILYSEDMHHGLEVDGRLKIVNPFL